MCLFIQQGLGLTPGPLQVFHPELCHKALELPFGYVPRNGLAESHGSSFLDFYLVRIAILFAVVRPAGVALAV